MILVDTSVWVAALRRPDEAVSRELQGLVNEGQVAIAGVVLTEVLQGARTEEEFGRFQTIFAELPLVEATRNTWVQAGEIGFRLRRQGRGIPLTDSLIAALALEAGYQLYTYDQHFRRVPGLELHHA